MLISRQQSYVLLGFSLVLMYVFVHDSPWRGSVELITVIEVLTTVLALMVALLALLRHFSQGGTKFLIIGVGFIGAALLDGYHALVTSAWFNNQYSPELSSSGFWSWFISRLFLALLLYLSWIIWKKEHQSSFKVSAKSVFAVTAASTAASFLIITLLPLPWFFNPELPIQHPEELLPALLFLLALIGYLRKGEWKSDNFEHWLVLALIINLVAQTVFMPFSDHLFDVEFEIVNLLKVVSYVCVLTGLLISMYETFSDSVYEAEIRKKAQLALMKSEARQKAVFTTMVDGLITINQNGIIESFNKAAQNIFGYRPLEVLGRNITMLMPEPDSKIHDSYLQNFINTGISNFVGTEREVSGMKKDGTIFPMEISIGEMNIGHEKKFHGVVRDITDRKQVEQDLIRARNEAEESAGVKGDFMATMSHEIRTPMNGVLGMIELLQDTKLDAEQKELVVTALDSGRALLTIINDILDFSKIEAGKLELDPIAFNLERISYDVAHLLKVKAAEKNIEQILYYHADCPQSFIADPGRIRQILLNLVGNAIKFTPQGHVMIEISSAQKMPDMHVVRFEIKDTGIGIDKADQARLFDSFTQADSSTSRNFGGTGLGLTICKRLIDIMQGELGVESIPGKGSNFWFTLELPVAEMQQPPTKVELNNVPVLVINDNNLSNSILFEQLQSWGMLIDKASSLETVKQKLLGSQQVPEPYHLIVLDTELLNTREIASFIKSDTNSKNIPLVLITSSSDKGDARVFKQAGFSAYLTKPVLSETLHNTLSRAISEVQVNDIDNPLITRHSLQDDYFTSDTNTRLRGRVLLAEDVIVNQKVAITLLKKLGLQVDIANNGAEVIKIWENQDFDLILMDCQMPEIDGYQATEYIRQNEQDKRTTIIALTANALSTDRIKCLDCGMDDYLSKPFSRKELTDILKKWLIATKSELVEINQDESTITNTMEMNIPQLEYIDNSVLEKLKDTMESEFEELVFIYIQQSEKIIGQSMDLLESNDLNTLERLAHSLKSSSGNVGATQLSSLSQHLEFSARNNESKDSIHESILNISREYQHVKISLQKYLSETPA